MKLRSVAGVFAVAASFAFGTSSPSFAQADINDAASAVYQKIRVEASQRDALIASGTDYDRIQEITNRLISAAPEMRPDAGSWAWDVTYIRSPKVNAFCLPGGKMIVSNSLVEQLALTDDELAAVMGHEMGHALLEHGKEAYAQRQVAQVAVGILGIIAAIAGARHHTDPSVAFNASTAVGTLGAEFLALRPYNRERELAADRYGAELAARAGFNAAAAVSLQQKMSAHSASAIEFLSTHPASETRIQALAEFVPATSERFASRRLRGENTAIAMAPTVLVASPVAAARQTNASDDAAIRTSAPQPMAVQSGSAANALMPTDTKFRQGTAVDADAITGGAAASMTSKYLFSAERYAKAQGCNISSATMIARAPTYESFEIFCSNSRRLSVRCEPGCSALQ